VPIYFVRFEDLLQDPKAHLEEVFKFVLIQPSIKGTVVEKRLDEVLSGGEEGHILYKLKQGGGSVNKNADKFKESQHQRIKEGLEEMIHYFGYAKKGDNALGFFDYKGMASQENTDLFEGFKQTNKKMEKWILEQKEEIRNNVEFEINHAKEGFSMIATKDVIGLKNIPTKSTIKELI
jgi:hypothetical protein